jgi:hypothetical protein
MAFSTAYTHFVSKSYAEKGQVGSALTGTMAAALAADATIWTIRNPETAVMPSKGMQGRRLYIERIHLQYTAIVAATVPVTAGRCLKLVRGVPTALTAADPSGGAAWVPVRKRSDRTDEVLGIGRVATTAALTTTGFTFEANIIQRMLLTQAGNSGNSYDEAWRFDGTESDYIYLLPGEILAIQAGQTFDAGLTWEINVDADFVAIP